MNQYKAGKPRFSSHYGYEVVDILVKRMFFRIPYWSHHDTIKNAGQVVTVLKYLNNPELLKAEIQKAESLPFRVSGALTESQFEFALKDLKAAYVSGQGNGRCSNAGLEAEVSFDEWYSYFKLTRGNAK